MVSPSFCFSEEGEGEEADDDDDDDDDDDGSEEELLLCARDKGRVTGLVFCFLVLAMVVLLRRRGWLQ